MKRYVSRFWRVLLVLSIATGLMFGAARVTHANLTGSTFEGGDGNLVVNTAGNTDWANVAGLNAGIDLPSGTSDNAFGQGTKEDNSAVTVVSGSIPPNKSDLTRFYQASESVRGQNFLYLAWERSNVLGSANMDFEINQNVTPGFSGSTTGPVTLNRTAGDLLVTYDFTNGGSTPTLGLLTWVTSGSIGQCFASNALPCWGNHQTLNSGDSEGAINTVSVTDPIAPNAPRTLPADTFGETAINLTAAGVFPSNTCRAFGDVFLKSRSSASFTAEVKDFVAPVPVNINNCGTVKIIKQSDPRGINQNFSFTSNIPNNASFTLNDSGNSTGNTICGTPGTTTCNELDMPTVPVGGYTVTEGANPAGFAFENLTCSATGAGTSVTPTSSTTNRTASITLAPDGVVTCTYTNQQQLGAIKISKTSIKGTALAGATFSIKDSLGNAIASSPVTTGSDGTACVDHLPFGTYSVQETAAPAGYSIDDSTAHSVPVNVNTTCGSGSEALFPATDTPLTDLLVKATSEATGGTKTSIDCKDASSNEINGSPVALSDPATMTATGLKPGTYTCTVVIDP